jgi:hypothetical protein
MNWYNVPNTTLAIESDIEVTLAGSNIKYYESLGYKIPSKKNRYGKMSVPWGSKIQVKANHLPQKAPVKVRCKCLKCGNDKDKFLNDWYTSLAKINSRRGCPKCNGRQTHSSDQIIKILKLNGVLIIGQILQKYSNEDIVRLECSVCGNKKDRTNRPWLAKIGAISNRKVACPYCNNFRIRSSEEVVELFKQHNLIILEKLPDNVTSNNKLLVKCNKCGNDKDRFSKNDWKIDINHLIGQKIGCPKCKRVQTLSSKELSEYLASIDIELIKKGKGSTGKNKLHCLVCDKYFEQNYDALRSKKRGCACEKYAWFAFESFIGEYFGGDANVRLNGAIPDKYFSNEKIILEIKYGKDSLSKRAMGQAKKYISTKNRVVYVICTHRAEINQQKLVKGIEYYFLDNMLDLEICGKKLNKIALDKIYDIYENPQKYSTRTPPIYYIDLKKRFITLCKEKERLPSTRELKENNIEIGTIKRIFGLDQNANILELSKATGFINIGHRKGANHQQAIKILVIDKNGQVILEDSMQGVSKYFGKSITWASNNIKKNEYGQFEFENYTIKKKSH